MTQRVLVKMRFGSHLYGTDTPESDTDYKGVFLPSLSHVVLGRAPKTAITVSTGDPNDKNLASDIDFETFTLGGFHRMLKEGQVVALDMLFAPEDMWLTSSVEWAWLVKNRQRFLHKNTSAFVGYCRKQASKYGVKGSRLADLKAVLGLLGAFDPERRLCAYFSELREFSADHEFANIVPVEKAAGHPEPLQRVQFECVDRKFGFTTKVGYVIDALTKVERNYGDRARAAQRNDGIDWKAISHAMRCCYQAVELLNDHRITFPLVQADYLRAVKRGRVPSSEAGPALDVLLGRVEFAKLTSTLPDKCDEQWLDDYLVSLYQE